jgi:hypothetical protein
VNGWREIELISSYPIHKGRSTVKIRENENTNEYDIYFFDFISSAKNGLPPSKTGKVFAYGKKKRLKGNKIFYIDLYINNEYVGLVEHHTNYLIDTDCNEIKNFAPIVYKLGRFPFKAVTRSGSKKGLIWTGTVDVKEYECEFLILDYDN